MGRGLFITLEGPDGSGKSTQAGYMEEYFVNRGMDAVFTREPGGTEIGEQVREIILDKENNEMDDMTEALLYAASRAQLVAEKIRPALESGRIVVCDRYVDSSIAYQGYGRGMGNVIEDINSYAIMGYMPDLTFLLDLDPRIGKERIDVHELDRLESEKIRFHDRVYQGYMDIAKKYPERIVLIDGGQSVESIREQIIDHLEHFLSNR